MDEYTARHMMVMAVIDYLSENMVYTLSPVVPSPTRDYVNAADTFLFDTQEGYCVQFATSAVMMIRSLGIPARYAEGYIASDFSRKFRRRRRRKVFVSGARQQRARVG